MVTALPVDFELKKSHIKASLNMPLMKSSADLSSNCALISWVFYYKFFQ